MRTVCKLALTLSLTGCIEETSMLEDYIEHAEPVDRPCLLAALRRAANDELVQEIDDIIPLGINHRYVFAVGRSPHHLSVLVRLDASVSLRHTVWATRLTLRELQRAEDSLNSVTEAVSAACALGWQDAQRACHGRACDALAQAG